MARRSLGRRVARALSKLGVHTQSDVERLAERVDSLSAAVNELIRSNGGAKVAAKPPAVSRARKGASETVAKGASARRTAPAGKAASSRKTASADRAALGKTDGPSPKRGRRKTAA